MFACELSDVVVVLLTERAVGPLTTCVMLVERAHDRAAAAVASTSTTVAAAVVVAVSVAADDAAAADGLTGKRV